MFDAVSAVVVVSIIVCAVELGFVVNFVASCFAIHVLVVVSY
jgi:hypothetical protein